MVDVALVQMPYAAVHHPSIALGLLKGALARANIRSEVVYANVLWGDDIGLDVYLCLEESPPTELLGEWTFAAAAFPERRLDVAAFRRVAPRSFTTGLVKLLAAQHPGLDVEALFAMVRDRAVRFVDRVARRIVDSGARVVGCSSMFQQHCASLALLRRIREIDAGIVTIIGGANCEGPMSAATHRAFPWVDFVASGEADDYFATFCADLLEHGRALPPERVPGGVLGPGLRASARPVTPGRPTLVADMDTTSMPDYDDYVEELGRSELGRYVRLGLLVETSRGCWYGARKTCTFCGLNGDRMEFRSKSPDRVRDELATLAGRYGVNRIAAVDNILDLSYLKELIPRLAEDGGLYSMFFEVRPNLSRAQLDGLAKAGIRWLQAGLEHLHDAVLAQVAKGTSGLQNVTFLKWARLSGVRVAWNMLHGGPGEQDQWYQELAEWLPLISHLQPPSGMSRIHYDRFSPFHVNARSYQLELTPCPAYAEVYGLPPAELGDLAYFFKDEGPHSAWDRQRHPGLMAVNKAIDQWNRVFWADPPPTMTMSWEGDDLVIADGRPIAPEREVRLRGLEAQVYWECAEPSIGHTLVTRLAPRVGAVEELAVAEALERLHERKLSLKLGGRYLSLALPARPQPFPMMEDAPEGYVSVIEIMHRYATTSLAREACRPEWNVPALVAFGAVPESR